MTKDGDNKAAKRARKIVDSTSSVGGPKNSILRHMQSSVIGSNIIRNNKNTNQVCRII